MGHQLIGFFGKALVPIAVLLVFALARKYMPAGSLKEPGSRYSLEELDLRFSKIQWMVGISMAAIGIVFAFAAHAALVWFNRYLASLDGHANFILWPQGATWWFFPGLGALTLSWEITLLLWLLAGDREHARLYNDWTALKSGFDAPKLLRWMALLIALPIGVLTTLELPVHTSLLPDEIRDCGYAFAPCKTYRYADALRMTIIDGFKDRDGKLTRRAGIVIDFSGGRRWSSADIGDFRKTLDPALEDFLEKKTNLAYHYAQTEVDIPPVN